MPSSADPTEIYWLSSPGPLGVPFVDVRAIIINENTPARLDDVDPSGMPDGDVTIDVAYSTLNYKDALALTGKAPIAKSFPMVPGIDLAGVVSASTNASVAVGTRVLVNGYGLGEKHWGGLAAQARVPADWAIPIPDAFTEAQAMAIGTAGYTAMLCVLALEDAGIKADAGNILVTGAAGGVGSVAVSVLARRGYTVLAATGRPHEADYLRQLGASDIVNRDELTQKVRALGKQRWIGAVDVVGSTVLANVLSMTSYGGAVAACGLAGGMDLPASVAPFILRGVRLLGVDSVYAPKPARIAAWKRLAEDLNPDHLAAITTTIGLTEAIEVSQQVLAGQTRGRVVVDVRK